jgi:predicted nucleotidyltransferase
MEGNPLIITFRGMALAALVPLANIDCKTVSLSTDPEFIEILGQSRKRVSEEGAVWNLRACGAYKSPLRMIWSAGFTDLLSRVLGGREMTSADYIKIMAERIVRDYDPVKIILFGSHARGEAGPESDIDLLVVLPEVASKRQTAVAIRRKLTDLPVPKDIVVTTPEEIARRGDLVGTVLRPALREGKVLYERS